MDSKKILKALKADYEASRVQHDNQMAKIKVYRNEYDGKPYGNEVKGRSRIVSRDIKKQSEWQHSTLLAPFVSTPDIVKVAPVTWEDVEAARQSETLLNYQFCRQFGRYNFMRKALKVLDTEGTLVVQTGWDYEEEEVEVEVPMIGIDFMGNEVIVGTETQTEIKIIRNQPTAVVCRNEDIFIDPTCMDDMDKCQFVVHRYETDLSTLRKDGRYKNLNKLVTDGESSALNDYDYDPEDETQFRFEDDPRKKIMVYEYWGNYDIDEDGEVEPIVCAWVGNVVIRLQTNPYPDKKPPFLVVPYNSVPFQIYGESDSELLSDSQKIKTAITRGIIDNMAKSNNGQKGIRKGALDATNRKKFINGEDFEFNGTPNDFWDGSFNAIPQSAFNMLGMVTNEIESLSATKSFSQGITGNSLGSTATGTKGALDATSIRKMDRVRNVSENLIKPLLRKWLAYSAEFMEESEIVRVTNDQFVEIRKDDLLGNVDLDIQVSTAEDNASKAQELAFMLQTLGQAMDAPMRNMIMAEIARLHDMPMLEKQLREYQPQPDPAAEQAKQLEIERIGLENEKLRADIADKYARSRENNIDSLLKMNKAKVEEMKARKLGSEADKLDIEFLNVDSGTAHREKMEIEELKRLSKLDEIAVKNMAAKSK